MPHQLKQLWDITIRCAVAKLDAELTAIKCARGVPDGLWCCVT
jgi:hypothetical protein